MDVFCGIDIGASAAKLVLIDAQRNMVSRALRRSGIDYGRTAETCLDEALQGAGLAGSDLAAGIATGYGRENVAWVDGTMTEIACHGKGAFHHFPRAITVIDIGAQDNKVIHLDDRGRRTNFKMNRKCAAGTGAFLEEIALRLDIGVGQMNGLAEAATEEITLGSFCTVFAATEILEKIRAGRRVEDIVKGAFRSVARRVYEMDAVSEDLVLTGGVVANNPILVDLIEESFGTRPLVPPEPQFIGALGAALLALERTLGKSPENTSQGEPAC